MVLPVICILLFLGFTRVVCCAGLRMADFYFVLNDEETAIQDMRAAPRRIVDDCDHAR
jgi:hypothetical protein